MKKENFKNKEFIYSAFLFLNVELSGSEGV
jgi:hypothetical protein